MSKRPEEGKIWEWRAFGSLSPELVAAVSQFPLRDGIVGRPEIDTYFISLASDHNIKIREAGGCSVLKLKLLLETGKDDIELYLESMDLIYDFPISKAVLDHVCELLKNHPAAEINTIQTLDAEGLINALSTCNPPVKKVEVSKTRSQHTVEGGWIELADMLFPHKRTHSISVHSHERKVVEETLARLDVGNQLKVMNYVQACRMWG